MAKRVSNFSSKQRKIFTWWHPESKVNHAQGIICDGSIRAGKTFPMAISFIEWAFFNFEDEVFALCGKTVGSLRRNVLLWLKPLLARMGFEVQEKLADGLLILKRGGKVNHFYLFGGRDESSQDLIQGVTLAGVFFDEVALMPESFVNQAVGRCSVEGSKKWFNCNPESPVHWFKEQWLDKRRDKGFLHIHFTMDDNPSLSAEKKAEYKSNFTGIFYKRMILGLWVVAEGAIYDMLDEERNTFIGRVSDLIWEAADHYIAIDVGTQNATVFLHIIDDGRNIWVNDEYYYSGKKMSKQKTNSQYIADLNDFIERIGFKKPGMIRYVVIDPSAASFKLEARMSGHRIKDADNDVWDGIQLTASMIGKGVIRINRQRCPMLWKEMMAYCWDAKNTLKGTEKPVKKDDHAPDALRYFNKTIYHPRRLDFYNSQMPIDPQPLAA